MAFKANKHKGDNNLVIPLFLALIDLYQFFHKKLKNYGKIFGYMEKKYYLCTRKTERTRIMKEIITSTNNKYYFYLCNKGNSNNTTSKEYSSKIKCIEDFCKAIRMGKENVAWGQFICHHYADQWQGEQREVIFTLTPNDL